MKYLLAIVTGVCVVIMCGIFVLGLLQKQQRESQTPMPPTLTSTSTDSTNPPSSQTTAIKTLTANEVARHNTASSCWLIISRSVYDVTTFLSQHPGGEAKIIPYCGKEATRAFETQDKISGGGHTQTAQQMLQSFKIGVVTN